MKCTDFSMNLVLENVMKIMNFQNFCCMQSFHDIQTVFWYCDGNEFFAHFRRTDMLCCFSVVFREDIPREKSDGDAFLPCIK